jgi:hypothetical protein
VRERDGERGSRREREHRQRTHVAVASDVGPAGDAAWLPRASGRPPQHTHARNTL